MMIIDEESAKALKEKFNNEIRREVKVKVFLDKEEKIEGSKKFIEEFPNNPICLVSNFC